MPKSNRTISKPISEGIYIAKGIAIILVVIGHYHPYWTIYWRSLHNFIYTFHMPLFMFISGMLFAKENYVKSLSEYKKLITNKFYRLILPYFSVSLIACLLKIIGNIFFDIRRPIDNNLLWYVFIDPRSGFVSILWFLYVLFEIFLIFPLLCIIIKEKYVVLLILFLLSLLCWPKILVFDRLFFYLPIFSFGFYAFDIVRSQKYRSSIIVLSFLIFIVLYFFVYTPGLYNGITENILRICMGLAGALFVLYFSIEVARFRNLFSQFLISLGSFSMSVYLFHTFSFAPVHIIFFQVFNLGKEWFLISAVVAVCMGVFLPILSEKYIIRKIPILSLLFLGTGYKIRSIRIVTNNLMVRNH
jgi:fucose 4-O-acetylase-like acetyltransferase